MDGTDLWQAYCRGVYTDSALSRYIQSRPDSQYVLNAIYTELLHQVVYMRDDDFPIYMVNVSAGPNLDRLVELQHHRDDAVMVSAVGSIFKELAVLMWFKLMQVQAINPECIIIIEQNTADYFVMGIHRTVLIDHWRSTCSSSC
jgi:hypothetical protein